MIVFVYSRLRLIYPRIIYIQPVNVDTFVKEFEFFFLKKTPDNHDFYINDL